MRVATVRPVCFSPTGTSKAVVRAIARGTGFACADLLDITAPAVRARPLRAAADELLVVAVPVYMGRVPAVLDSWLTAVEAAGTPAVCVVVYGNRVYEDALIELADRLEAGGCRPIAGAAFLGEHSFSLAETPTAAGRPDAGDLALAESFGRAIGERVLSTASADALPAAALPGCRPYRGDPTLWQVDFIAVGGGCTQCGICAAACPVGAIDPDDSTRVDTARCITCCACIKRCPEQARTMKPGLVMDASIRLHTLYAERKEPEVFL